MEAFNEIGKYSAEIISVCALAFQVIGKHVTVIVALCALGLTAWSGHAQRKHNRLSVKPHLTSKSFKYRNDDMGTIKMELMNPGVGPAYFTKVQFYLDKEPCEYETAFRYLAKNLDGTFNLTDYKKGHVMKAGEIDEVLFLKFSCTSDLLLDDVANTFNQIGLVVDYQCLYKVDDYFNTFEE